MAFSIRSFFGRETGQVVPPIDINTYISGFSPDNNPTVNKCESLIANTVSVIDISLYVHTTGGGRKKAAFNPLYYVIQNPAVEESPTLFWNTLYHQILKYGNGYLYKLKNGAGEVIGLQLLQSSDVKITRDNLGKKLFNIKSKAYTSDDIVHIPYFAEYDGTKGKSPRELASKYILLDNVIQDYVQNYFQNSIGNRLSIELAKENAEYKDAERATVKLIEWANRYVVGAQNSGKPVVAPPFGKLVPLNQPSNVEAELNSLKLASEKQIAESFYGVPWSVISESNSYNSLEQRQMNFYSTCIQPLAFHVAECLTYQLLSASDIQRGLHIAYDFSNFIQADMKVKMEYATRGLQAGVFTINEMRQMFDLDNVGDIGEVHFGSLQLYPLTMDNINAWFAAQKDALEKGAVKGGDNPTDSNHSPQGDDKA